MFWNPRDLRAVRRTPAYWLAIIVLVVAARPVAASELMAASPPRSAPPALIKSHARERHAGGSCRSGQCGPSTQHQRHADRCEGRCANGNCGKPGCPAHCPVRPDRFGFYGTQWRVWPGQGVVQASFTDAATPARPPKSEVPSADEESPRSAAELPADEESRDEEPREEEPREEAPAPEPLPPAKAPAAPAAKEPAIEKPAPPAAEENLFDEASHRRRRHEVLANLQQSAMRSELARQEALRQQARQAQTGAMTGLPQVGAMATPSAVRTVAHEEPVPSSEPPRVNPLR